MLCLLGARRGRQGNFRPQSRRRRLPDKFRNGDGDSGRLLRARLRRRHASGHKGYAHQADRGYQGQINKPYTYEKILSHFALDGDRPRFYRHIRLPLQKFAGRGGALLHRFALASHHRAHNGAYGQD